LSESGLRVLSKTTGSKPVIIFPDGQEKEIKRRGSPSILEQKRLLRLGEKLGADALVCEMMGIHPESGCTESTQIMRPQIQVITNVRLDHLAQMGPTRERAARIFSSWIPERSTVFVPEGEFYPDFGREGRKRGSKIIPLSEDFVDDFSSSAQRLLPFERKENIALALAVTEHLRVDRETALQGMVRFVPDFGSLKIWKADRDRPPRSCFLVSCFAANDPESTGMVLSSLKERGLFQGKKTVGILNLREDRGDRTLQWLQALEEGAFSEFSRFYLVGLHGPAFRQKLRGRKKESFIVLKARSPEEIMSRILDGEEQEFVLVGMGNIGGAGDGLVHYWESVGESYDL
jgi:poly-gamma-glutamate synthase PgsB/CapB